MKTLLSLALCLGFVGCSTVYKVLDGPQSLRDKAYSNYSGDWDACNSYATAQASRFENRDTALIQKDQEFRRCMLSKGR